MNFIANLVNTKTGRHHTLVFRPAPFPGGGTQPVLRYKTLGHHTVGFDTRSESMTHAHELADPRGWEVVDVDYEWDGEGVPALSVLSPLGMHQKS